MNTIRTTLLSFAALMGALVASAQQAPVEAFVSAIAGTASFTAPGATTSSPLTAGQALPEGSTVTTDKDSTALVQSHEGIQTGLNGGTTAVIGAHSVSADGVRLAVIDLKEGTTVSVLDPRKKAINNYGVRTPKGVAAARGTTYATTVKVNGKDVVVTVNTLTGAVNFSIAGGASISVAEGNMAGDKSTQSTSLNDALKNATADSDVVAALKATVKVVSAIAQISDETKDTHAKDTLKTVVENVKKAAKGTAVEEVVDENTKEAQEPLTLTVSDGKIISATPSGETTQKNYDAPKSTPGPDITIRPQPVSTEKQLDSGIVVSPSA